MILNPVDGIIIRPCGPYNYPAPTLRNPFKLESAAVTALFFSQTKASYNAWRPWGLSGKALQRQRSKVRHLIDAFIQDSETLQILKNIDIVQQGGPGTIGGYPVQVIANQYYPAGTRKFMDILGSPAGKWVSEFLLSYDNPKENGLGRLLIIGITVWRPDPNCDLPALLWSLEPFDDRAAQGISGLAMGYTPEPII